MSTIFATMTVYDDDDNPLALDITGYYNPAQNGGWDEPSYSAYIDDIRAFTQDGSAYVLSKLELQLAEEALWESIEGRLEHEQDMDDYYREEERIRKAEMMYEEMIGG
jgi:hypothetical protein